MVTSINFKLSSWPFPAIERELDRVSEVLARSRTALSAKYGLVLNNPEILRRRARPRPSLKPSSKHFENFPRVFSDFLSTFIKAKFSLKLEAVRFEHKL